MELVLKGQAAYSMEGSSLIECKINSRTRGSVNKLTTAPATTATPAARRSEKVTDSHPEVLKDEVLLAVKIVVVDENEI